MNSKETYKCIIRVNRLNILAQFNSSKYLPAKYCLIICFLINFSKYQESSSFLLTFISVNIKESEYPLNPFENQ